MSTNVVSSKYASDPLFTEFLKVRMGAEAVKQNEEEDEKEENSTQVLLGALDEFKGMSLFYSNCVEFPVAGKCFLIEWDFRENRLKNG